MHWHIFSRIMVWEVRRSPASLSHALDFFCQSWWVIVLAEVANNAKSHKTRGIPCESRPFVQLCCSSTRNLYSSLSTTFFMVHLLPPQPFDSASSSSPSPSLKMILDITLSGTLKNTSSQCSCYLGANLGLFAQQQQQQWKLCNYLPTQPAQAYPARAPLTQAVQSPQRFWSNHPHNFSVLQQVQPQNLFPEIFTPNVFFALPVITKLRSSFSFLWYHVICVWYDMPLLIFIFSTGNVGSSSWHIATIK